jgi:hypothetical protein
MILLKFFYLVVKYFKLTYTGVPKEDGFITPLFIGGF